jgi:hypothetical protein
MTLPLYADGLRRGRCSFLQMKDPPRRNLRSARLTCKCGALFFQPRTLRDVARREATPIFRASVVLSSGRSGLRFVGQERPSVGWQQQFLRFKRSVLNLGLNQREGVVRALLKISHLPNIQSSSKTFEVVGSKFASVQMYNRYSA